MNVIPISRGHFTAMEDHVVDELLFQCGPAATGIYLYLTRRANKQGVCRPAVSTIADDCGVSERTVQRIIHDKLIPAGFVVRKEIKTDSGRTKGVEYTLPFHMKAHEVGGDSRGDNRGDNRGDTTPVKMSPKVDTSSGEVDMSMGATKRGTQIAQDFTPTPQDIAKLESEGILPEQAMAEVPKFIDYYTGHGKAMKNWSATFRNWVRNAKSYGKLEKATPVRRLVV